MDSFILPSRKLWSGLVEIRFLLHLPVLELRLSRLRLAVPKYLYMYIYLFAFVFTFNIEYTKYETNSTNSKQASETYFCAFGPGGTLFRGTCAIALWLRSCGSFLRRLTGPWSRGRRCWCAGGCGGSDGSGSAFTADLANHHSVNDVSRPSVARHFLDREPQLAGLNLEWKSDRTKLNGILRIRNFWIIILFALFLFEIIILK